LINLIFEYERQPAARIYCPGCAFIWLGYVI
jgi:hypothetical protein